MDISFTQRLQNISAFTKHFTNIHGHNSTDAKSSAIGIEQDYFATSTSASEYQSKCSQVLNNHARDNEIVKDEAIQSRQAEYVNHIFNKEALPIGQYIYPTFHAEGRTSIVYKAKATKLDNDLHTSNNIVVLKVTHPDRLMPPHDSRRECRLLTQARHESVIPLLDHFHQPGGVFVLVFPFAQLDLENLLRTSTLTRCQLKLVFIGLFSALAHIHSLGIIHRDVKPANILLRSIHGPVNLIDFGIAWSASDMASEASDKKFTDVGTTCYRPPEILFGYRSYGSSLDVWAAGCIVAELLRQDHAQLFDAGPLGSELGLIKSMFQTLGTPTDESWPSSQYLPDWSKISFQKFPGKSWKDILSNASIASIDFAQRTLCYEWTKRLTAQEALEHPLAFELGVKV